MNFKNDNVSTSHSLCCVQVLSTHAYLKTANSPPNILPTTEVKTRQENTKNIPTTPWIELYQTI